jgi:hypothetical protein
MLDDGLQPWEVGVRRGGKMDLVVMSKNLLEFKEVMDKHKVRFLLFFGTLLGLKRNKEFISYDTDVDVICFWPQYLNWLKVKDELRLLGFVVVDKCPLHDEHIIRGGEKIEIWWMGKIFNQIVYDNNIRFDENLILPTKQEEFLGISFEIPAQSEKILELLYGKDWIIPRTDVSGSSYRAE